MEDDEAVRRTRLLEAQSLAAELFEAVEEEQILRPGVGEAEASHAIAQLAADRFGVTDHWHKRIVRSGPNTLHPYRAEPPDRRIAADDVAFADFGPIFAGWEADFGRTWVIGDDPEKIRLRDDTAEVFALAKNRFLESPDITAAELHREVLRLAGERGWGFGNFHCGHLVGEYPHEDMDGAREDSYICEANDAPLRGTDPSGRIAHWILEIHLIDEERRIGGFFEELLTI